MADKSFGVKDVNLIGASGTPTIDSPNNLNINAVNVAISTDMSIGGNLSVAGSITGPVGSIVKLGTVATNTGTEAAFTNIPSTAKKITVAIHNFGFTGSSDTMIMEVGDSNGYATTEYQSSYDNVDQTSDAQSSTTFYGLNAGADQALEYNITVELVNVTGNSWTISHTGASSSSSGEVIWGGGSKSLSNTLDRLRIKTAGGRTLDHGHVTVYYETASDAPAANTVSSDAIVLQTAKSSATGTSDPIEFTDIPEDAYEITLMFNGVSLSGSENYFIQLGTSSGYIETGYTATSQSEAGSQGVSSIVGFIVMSTSSSAVHHGKFDINKFSDTAYTFEGQTRRDSGAGTQAYGSLNSVNGTITRLRIKPSGTNNFTAGSFNISYKTPGSANEAGIVSVKDYGAVGDGSTNDTSAIQSALSSSAKAIYFPTGDYRIASSLTSSVDGRKIYGEGSITATADVNKAIIFNSSDYVELSLNCKGNNYINVFAQFNDCLDPHIHHCRVRDLQSPNDGTGGKAIAFEIFSDIDSGAKITDNYITNLNAYGDGTAGNGNGMSRAIAFDSTVALTKPILISDNVIDTVIGEEGDAISIMAKESGTQNYFNANVFITGNHIKNFNRRGCKIKFNSAVVSNNTFYNTWTSSPTSPQTVVDLVEGSNHTVVNNNFINTEYFSQIKVLASRDDEKVNNCIIKGNTFTRIGSSTSSTMIYYKSSQTGDKGSGVTIKDNSFDCPGYVGTFIKVDRTKDVIVTGNTFIKSSSAVGIQTTSVDNMIEQNNFSIDIS